MRNKLVLFRLPLRHFFFLLSVVAGLGYGLGGPFVANWLLIMLLFWLTSAGSEQVEPLFYQALIGLGLGISGATSWWLAHFYGAFACFGVAIVFSLVLYYWRQHRFMGRIAVCYAGLSLIMNSYLVPTFAQWPGLLITAGLSVVTLILYQVYCSALPTRLLIEVPPKVAIDQLLVTSWARLHELTNHANPPSALRLTQVLAPLNLQLTALTQTQLRLEQLNRHDPRLGQLENYRVKLSSLQQFMQQVAYTVLQDEARILPTAQELAAEELAD